MGPVAPVAPVAPVDPVGPVVPRNENPTYARSPLERLPDCETDVPTICVYPDEGYTFVT